MNFIQSSLLRIDTLRQNAGHHPKKIGNLHVDLGHAANEQLEFSFIEDINEFLGDEFVETRHESIELFLDPLLDTVGDHTPREG